MTKTITTEELKKKIDDLSAKGGEGAVAESLAPRKSIPKNKIISSSVSAMLFALVLLIPTFVSADSIPAVKFCSLYKTIPRLASATVSAEGDGCQLDVDGKNKKLSVKVQISDFTGFPEAADVEYSEFERGANVLLIACDTADHPCDLKTQTSGSLQTNVVTYSVPDEDDQSIFFNWGAGELAFAVDQYREHVYSIFAVQGDSDGKVDNPGIHAAIIAKTKEIIDTRTSDASGVAEDGTEIEKASTDKSVNKETTEGEESDEEADDEDGPKTLKVLSISEDVEIQKEGGGWQEATTGMQLEDGDEISTGPDSVITLQFPDGTIMQVSELTQVRVGFLLAEGNAVRAEIQLKLGKVAARVNPKKTSFTDFTVKSPIATASVRGTTFGVIYHANTGMRVMVDEGTVAVTANDGTSQDVSAGYDVRVTDEGFGEQYPFDGTLFEEDISAFVDVADSLGDSTTEGGSGNGLNPLVLVVLAVVVAGGFVLVLVRRRS